MELTTILNRCHHFRGFVYEHARFTTDKKSIEVVLRPRKGSDAVCSRCHLPAPGYDQLAQRRFEFIPLWGFFVFLLYAMRRVDCRRSPSRFRKIDMIVSLESPETNRGQNLSAEAREMLPHIYDELRRLAHFYLRRERPDHTLQPTALVHEAYVRLAAQHNLDWENRVQVMALAASMMRRVLLDYANARKAAKRPASGVRVPLSEALAQASNPIEFLDLNSALDALAQLDGRQARVVEMRFFGGMSIEEIAAAAGISTATVERELRTARLWLVRRLAGGS
jgi:RNA polymerase sigma factor (TIGR02999 family)